MIPRRPAQLFRSRWSALWWAFTVVLGAVLMIGPEDKGQAADGNGGTAVAAADARALTNLIAAR